MASVALGPIYEDHWHFPRVFSGKHGPKLNDTILIYLTIGSSVIPMRVLESDSIASVKLRIQTQNGIVMKKQKLVFDGKELSRNNSSVRDYGVADGNVLHLILRLSDLQAIIVRTMCGKEFEFRIDRKRNVEYLKQLIAKREKSFFNLKNQELFCDGEELEDQRIIDNICKNSGAVIHFLVRKSAKIMAKPLEKDLEISIFAPHTEKVADAADVTDSLWTTQSEKLKSVAVKCSQQDFVFEPLTDSKFVSSPVIKQLIDATFNGLQRGKQPIRSSEGSGGAYFMPDSSSEDYISIFKPVDEEPMAVNNPQGLPLSTNGEGLKKGTRVGEGAIREVAAYILDHPTGGPHSFHGEGKGFAGVPPTIMVKCGHRVFKYPDSYQYASSKIGSLQMFMKNCGSCEDMGPRLFPVEEVHKISVLDIRLANADRHAGNILVQKDGEEGRITLIPIDHGYCLPENFEDCTFDWLYWPQAQQPFSPDTIAYIKSLDAEKDIQLLKFHGWNMPQECARVFHISTMLLKKGAERGLTPFAIGSIMCRETLKKESVIEKIVQDAQEAVLPGTSESAFLESIAVIMDRYLDEFSP